MSLIDTHAHIYLEDFKEDIDTVISVANQIGVSKILLPNIDADSVEDMLHLEERYPNQCYAMMGLHPCSVNKEVDKQLRLVEEWLSKRSFLAVGEIGTDLYWDKTFWEDQKKAFIRQCGLAVEHELPVVIHCRDSIDETITLIKNLKYVPSGVFHCFTGTLDQAKEILDLGFYLGLGGVVTFKNGGMDKVVPSLDPSKIVLETDSPYLSPAPERGKRNEPAKVKIVAEKVAEFLDMSLEEVAKLTTENANDLFFRQ